jgi:hypothetical protein
MRPGAVISGLETTGIFTAFCQAACAFCTKLRVLPISAIPVTHFVSRLGATRGGLAASLRRSVRGRRLLGLSPSARHKAPEDSATGSDKSLQQGRTAHAQGVVVDGGHLIRIRLKSRLSFWFFSRAVLRGPVVLPRRGWPFPDGAREIALRPGRGCVSVAPLVRGAILPRSWRCRLHQGCSLSPASSPPVAAARPQGRL